MNSGELVARRVPDGAPCRVAWQNGRLTDFSVVETPDVPSAWIAPALVDLQVNGFAGVDFQRDGLTAPRLLDATRALRRSACAHYLLTLITDEWTRLLARLRHLKALRDASAELKEAIIGWHVEGPFLSPEPGFRGAHNPDVMCDPSPAHIEQLKAVTGDDPVFLTVAPEREGSAEAIQAACSAGFKVSFGHTNASAARLAAGIQAGGSAFTHLANGCPQQLDRHDNIVWRVFDQPTLTVGVIPDRIHVSPALFRTMHRAFPVERLYYTTDAMSAAGAPPGRYTIAHLELEVGADRVVRLPGAQNFAGSSLTPIEQPFFAAGMRGVRWQDCWRHCAEIPAAFIGLEHGLRPGAPATFCVIEASPSNELTGLKVYSHGAPQS
jgi:N-acetylglucosamine-6-phosphate deacetylase